MSEDGEPLDWYDASTASGQSRIVDDWDGAPIGQLAVLRMLFSVSREQVTNYGPAFAGDTPPERFVFAQLLQAQNLWKAGQVRGDGDMSEGAFVYQPRPLDKTIRGVIRPPDGKPDVL